MRSLLLSFALAVTLTACGFHPLHATSYEQSLSVNLSDVQIVTDNSRLGQLLKAEIKDQVNPTAKAAMPHYTLSISFQEYEIPLFINPDGTSSRGDLQYRSTYSLLRLSDSKAISHGVITRIGSYNTSQNADYASFVSEEDARKRAILELAQDYKLRLANLLPLMNNPDAVPVAVPAVTGPPSPILFPSTNDPHEIRSPGL